MAILIKNGKLITAEDSYFADIYIEGEKIQTIGENLQIQNVNIIDAANLFIMPGGVDPHTHFDLPMFGTVSSDDHYTGHKAAAFGGTTTVIDFIPQDFPTIDECIVKWKTKAQAKAAIDYSFHMNITNFNNQIANQLPQIIDHGITSIKVFMAYNNRLRLQDADIFQLLRITKADDILTLLHAENGDVIDILIEEALMDGHTSPIWHAHTRPAWGAIEATLRGSALAAQADTRLYIVHINAGGEVDQLQYARENGIQVMGETCPQYMFFTEEELKCSDGAKWICSPPLRTTKDIDRIWQGIADGTIQVIGTDHCPFFYDGTKSMMYEGVPIAIPGKELGKGDFTKIPNGLPVIGDRLPILWSYGVRIGRITENQFVALTSTNPAKVFGLYPKKGALEPGSDADLIIWDPNKIVKYGVNYAQHRTDYNLFEGWELIGFPIKVFLRGKLIVDQGRWYGTEGNGQFIFREPNTTFL